MNKQKEKHLDDIYFDLKHGGSFGGVDKLFRAVKKIGKFNISQYQIKKWLSKHRTYT